VSLSTIAVIVLLTESLVIVLTVALTWKMSTPPGGNDAIVIATEGVSGQTAPPLDWQVKPVSTRKAPS